MAKSNKLTFYAAKKNL